MAMHKRLAAGVLAAVIALAGASVVPAAAEPTTIELISGAGGGTTDPHTEVSTDGGATYQPARVTSNSQYDVISGTRYVSDDSLGSQRQNTTTLFRTTFTLQAASGADSITVCVHADNAARVLLNGTQIGAQPEQEIFANFRNPAECYTTSGPFIAGANVLEFVVRNFSGPMALDYRALVTLAVNEPPTLQLPSDITIDATSPAGAVVSYTATASDDTDPAPTVECQPASGSTFPIGTSMVLCTATDDDGASSAGGFSIMVRGADEQLGDLRSAVEGVGPGRSLAAKVANARSALASGDVSGACGLLAAFVNEVEAQSGKSLTATQAAELLDDANRIRSVIGCIS